MINFEFDESVGYFWLWRAWDAKEDESIPAQEVAVAYQARLRELGVREAMIPNVNPSVATALFELPGFQFEREGAVWLARPWPSGIDRCDMTGAEVVAEADEPRVYNFLTKETEIFDGSREDLQPIFAPDGCNVFLTEAGRDVAFGSVTSNRGVGWVGYVAVLPSERRRGLGSRAMEILLVTMDKVPLEKIILNVNADNAAAMRLYEKFGFVRSAPAAVWVKFVQPE